MIGRKQWILFYILCLAIAALLLIEGSYLLEQRTKVVVLDVGQGDAILIRTPEHKTILIDAGPPDGTVLESLAKELGFFDKTIDLWVLTHPHLDHYGGLFDVMDHYEVKKILMSGAVNKDPVYQELVEWINRQEISIEFAREDVDYRIGLTAYLDILYPLRGEFMVGQVVPNPNNASVAIRLMEAEEGHLKSLMLLSGDAEKDEECGILMSGQLVHSPILKLGHHGSRTSTTPAFLRAVNPRRVVISNGKENDFGHPHPETLEKVKALEVHETAKEGNVVFWF